MKNTKQPKKSNKGVLILGVILVIVGIWLIFSSGANFSNLPLLDMTAKIGSAEIMATDISPESQTKMMAGVLISIVGVVLIKIGM